MEILAILEDDNLNRHKNGKLFQSIGPVTIGENNVNLADMYTVNERDKPWCMFKTSRLLLNNVSFLDNFIKPIKMDDSDSEYEDEDDTKDIVNVHGFINFIVGGGWFTKKDDESDIDIFIYRDHERTLKNLVSYFCGNNYQFTRRTKYLVQLESHDWSPPIQIILRKYSTIAEILYGFDIGSSQIGYDGKTLYYTVLSKFALETGYNIVDPSRLSPSYEHRLVKYHDRGFGFIYPFLSKSNVASLVELEIGNLKLKPSLATIAPPTGEEYDGLSSRESHRFSYTKPNIAYLLGHSDNFIVDSRDRLLVTKKDIKFFYDTTIDVEDPNPRFFFNFDASLFKPRTREMFFYVKEKSKEVIEYLLKKLKFEIPYFWITENPGQQLSGSIKPLPTKPCDYYGSYYNPIWSREQHTFCSKELKAYMRCIHYLFSSHYIPNDVCFYVMDIIAIFYFIEGSNVKKTLKRKRETEDEEDVKFIKRRKPNAKGNIIWL